MRYRIRPLLLILLIFVPSYVIAEEIRFFSIDGTALTDDDRTVGQIIRYIPGKINVREVSYKSKTYFMKEASIEASDNLELRSKVDGIVSSRILNIMFKDKEKRYPSIMLAFDPKYYSNDGIPPFRILSEDLTKLGFKSITEHERKHTIFYEDELENFYVGMYFLSLSVVKHS